MKIGIIGPGKWGSQLGRATLLPIFAHARSASATEPIPEFGKLLPWKELALEADAVICAAPPNVTLEVALWCAWEGKAALVTKPLSLKKYDLPAKLRAPLWVDFARLWSPAYIKWKNELRAAQGEVKTLKIDFYGRGPYRTFPGLWDYGSHVFAMLNDLGTEDVHVEKAHVIKGEDPDPAGRLYGIVGTTGRMPFEVLTGNGAPKGTRRWEARLKDGRSLVYDETMSGTTFQVRLKAKVVESLEEPPWPFPMSAMVKAFVTTVSEKNAFVGRRTLDLAISAARTIATIERMTVEV